MKEKFDKIALPESPKRAHYLTGVVDQGTTSSAIQAIQAVNEYDDNMESFFESKGLQGYDREPIKLYIDSIGGKVHTGFGVCDVIRQSKTEVHTYVLGEACSMGLLIAVCGHYRFCYENSSYMFHQLSGGALGKLEDMNDSVEWLNIVQKRIDKILIEQTSLTQKMLDENRKLKKDEFMFSEGAIDLKLVDEVIE